MARGYMDRLLNVDLSSGSMTEETPTEELNRNYIGGYGIGARLLYDRIPRGADPLGPENILGILTGPLTGTQCIEGNRSVVVCKSPLTGGWGDANCGGTFGPYLKFAGYDGVLFSGVAESPVFLYIENGQAELRDASHLWGKDTNETEAILKSELGKDIEIASIGQSGERLSLISCIINDEGRAWGRSGVGAVMGSKKLKAVVVKGNLSVPVADEGKARALRREYLKRHGGGFYEILVDHGTIGITAESAVSGDSPIKNWGGVGEEDYPIGEKIFDPDEIIEKYQAKKYGCWRCTMACGGHMVVKEEGPYQGTAHHKIEYETAAAFGGMNLVDDVPSLIKANELCNKYGLDTISAGCTISFAIECYENEIIGPEHTDGIELRWGNHEAMIAMLEKLALREGFGDVLADGVQRAAEHIGKGSDEYAIHIQGQEIPMHDPKFQPGLATTYVMDATPGRHTQGHEGMLGYNYEAPSFDSQDPHGRGELHNIGAAWVHVVNAAGICLFAFISYDYTLVSDFLQDVTGWSWSEEEVVRAGERIAMVRHAFNLREGLNPLNYDVPGRLFGTPPQKSGPLTDITIDVWTQVKEYCEVAGLDPETAVPTQSKLRELGLDDMIENFYTD